MQSYICGIKKNAREIIMKEKKTNEALRYIRTSNREINKIRHYANETDEHKELKAQLAKEYIENGHYIMTEAIFKTGGRADLVVLDDFEIIEIKTSESEESINDKRIKYPKCFEIKSISTCTSWN